MNTPDLATARWRKSTHSGASGGECVELARAANTLGVRDSKAPEAGHLALTLPTAVQLLAQIKDGALDA